LICFLYQCGFYSGPVFVRIWSLREGLKKRGEVSLAWTWSGLKKMYYYKKRNWFFYGIQISHFLSSNYLFSLIYWFKCSSGFELLCWNETAVSFIDCIRGFNVWKIPYLVCWVCWGEVRLANWTIWTLNFQLFVCLNLTWECTLVLRPWWNHGCICFFFFIFFNCSCHQRIIFLSFCFCFSAGRSCTSSSWN